MWVVVYITWLKTSLKEQSYCCLNMVLVFLCLQKSEVLLREKPQCGLNLAFDSKVTRFFDKVICIKLEATCYVYVDSKHRWSKLETSGFFCLPSWHYYYSHVLNSRGRVIFSFLENFTTYFTLLWPLPKKEFLHTINPLFLSPPLFVPMTCHW